MLRPCISVIEPDNKIGLKRVYNTLSEKRLGRYELIIRFSSPSLCVLGPVPNFFYVLYIKYKVSAARKIMYLQDFYISYSVNYRNREYT